MFMQRDQDTMRKLDEGFGFSVESIMRCEDFKSNFARRLSNRYTSKPALTSPRPELTLRTVESPLESPKLAAERIEPTSQLSTTAVIVKQNVDVVKPPDKAKLAEIQQTEVSEPLKKTEFQRTEVHVLNMEVETLRWQLTQTEGNRQMHIALLKQLVTFLNRVKDHIEQNSDEKKRDSMEAVNVNDLPRARSYLHMNKNIKEELALNSPKKNTRKISKSISNVNGYKDISGLWKQSKLSLAPENEAGNKINEEISRLINLANTVLSTKIPDLACSCIENINDINTVKLAEPDKETNNNDSMISLNLINDPTNLSIIDININDINLTENDKNNDFNHTVKTNSIMGSNIFESCALKDDLASLDPKEKPFKVKKRSQSFNSPKVAIDKKNHFNVMNFFDDESGFSSMSSFQEIGIPIISIIPPSPSKDMGYSDELPLLSEADKWKADTVDLEKQSMQVFWV